LQQVKRIGILTYILTDLLTAMLAWTCFFAYRKYFVEDLGFELYHLNDSRYFIGVLLLPLCWLLFYALAGTYTDVYRKSRLSETSITFMHTLIGVLIIFFAVLLDDVISDYKKYYSLIAALFGIHFLFTISGRLNILTQAKSQIRKKLVAYDTLIVGGSQKAVDTYLDIEKNGVNLGYNFVGYLASHQNKDNPLDPYLPKVGWFDDLKSVIEKLKVDELILAIQRSESKAVSKIINQLSDTDVVIKIIPEMRDILSGSVKMNNVVGMYYWFSGGSIPLLL